MKSRASAQERGGQVAREQDGGRGHRREPRSRLLETLRPRIISNMDSTVKTGKFSLRPSLEIVAGTAPAPRHLATANGHPLGGVRVVLAPLCGFTDAVFRRICLEMGADLAVTEMISSEGLVRNSRHIRALRHLDMTDGPLVLQIFGADPEGMGKAAEILSRLEPRFIDLNFGCPVRKVVNQNGGSAILKDTTLLGKICRRVVEKSRAPVSAKIRAGWEKASTQGLRDIARVIEDSGVSALTVHARTRSQSFGGQADWSLIKTVKESVSIPVVGNGDVKDARSYFRMRETTGCDAVMIGRSAIGNPWVFEEIQAAVEGKPYAPPGARERVAKVLSHVRACVENDGEPYGIVTTRRMMAAYLRHIPHAREVRAKMMGCTRLAELEDVLASLLRAVEHTNSFGISDDSSGRGVSAGEV